jgi:Ca2+-binding EF-hand superfamily protein
MNLKRLALMSCVAVTLAAPAFADAGRGLFKAADTNQDGVVDQTEFQASRDKWFAALDADKDGFVTADEVKAFGAQMHAKWAAKHADAAQKAPDADRADRMAQHMLARIDTDKDGKISKAEIDAESAALFKRLDKNADGKIASDEVRHHRWGGKGAGMLGRMDTDKDGNITKAEFTTAEDQMFQKLDANGDGVISQDEMQAAHRHHHGGQAPDGNAAPSQAPTP